MPESRADYNVLFSHLRRIFGKFRMWDEDQRALRIIEFNALAQHYDYQTLDAVFRSWENAHRIPQIGRNFAAERELHYRQLIINS